MQRNLLREDDLRVQDSIEKGCESDQSPRSKKISISCSSESASGKSSCCNINNYINNSRVSSPKAQGDSSVSGVVKFPYLDIVRKRKSEMQSVISQSHFKSTQIVASPKRIKKKKRRKTLKVDANEYTTYSYFRKVPDMRVEE
jgi:hypothetical protein